MAQVTFDFTGKNFIVTGASSGMGRQIALELAEAGAKVLAIARRQNELEKLKEVYPENIIPASLDVCDEQKVEMAIKEFVSDCGKIDGAVHAAGISDITPIKNYDKNLADEIMNINFWAAISLINLAIKTKYANNNCSYILFSSVAAFSSEKGMFAYSAAKSAINSAIKSIAKEISKKNQRINTIVPGWIKTPMTDKAGQISNLETFFDKHLLGAGNPEDVSGMVLFLLSDRAKWITGTDVVVDGGYLA